MTALHAVGCKAAHTECCSIHIVPCTYRRTGIGAIMIKHIHCNPASDPLQDESALLSVLYHRGVVILCTDTHLGFTAAVIRTNQADIQCDILTDLLWQIGAAVSDFSYSGKRTTWYTAAFLPVSVNPPALQTRLPLPPCHRWWD